MYLDKYSEKIIKEIKKLKKKNPKQFNQLMNKINKIIEEPLKEYKNLRHNLKEFKRVHVGSFVLIFKIDIKKKQIIFEDYEHHDKIYKTKK